MADRRVSKLNDLSDRSITIEPNANYKKVMRFGDEKLKSEVTSVLDRNDKQWEEERLAKAYQEAFDLMKQGSDTESVEAVNQLKDAGEQFKKIANYRDAEDLAAKCFALSKAIHQLEVAQFKRNQREFEAAEKLFSAITGYKDSDEMAINCQKEGICAVAMSKMNGFSIEPYDEAIKILETVRGYHDDWCDADELLKRKLKRKPPQKREKNRFCLSPCSSLSLLV